MADRTVKFSDLLTRPAEFAALEAPPSPSSQLETLSSSTASSDESDESDESTTPTTPTTPTAPSAMPGTPQDAMGAREEESGTPDAEQPGVETTAPVAAANVQPAPTEPGSIALTEPTEPTESTEPTSGQGATPMPALATAAEEAATPQPEATTPPQPDATTPPEPDATTPPQPEETSPPTSAPEAAAPSTPQPPAPELEPAGGPGSVFNLQGLQAVFPMQPTAVPGFAVVPTAEAQAAARGLGLAAPLELRVPSATRLPGGAVLVAAPTAAVSLARLSAPCGTALAGADARSSLDEALALARRLLQDLAEETTALKLSDALSRLQRSGALACDPALEAVVRELRAFFGKLKTTVERRRAAELTQLRHADELRDRKRDLQALAEVVREDARAAAAARAKLEALRRERLPAVARELAAAARQLERLRALAEQLRRLPAA